VNYHCRCNPAELALMLLNRGTLDSTALTIAESHDVLTDPDTFDEVGEVLDEVHHLNYVGAGSARLPWPGPGTGHARLDPHPAPRRSIRNP